MLFILECYETSLTSGRPCNEQIRYLSTTCVRKGFAFPETCRKILKELEIKYGGESEMPQKTQEEIINEVTLILCQRFGFKEVQVGGKFSFGGVSGVNIIG